MTARMALSLLVFLATCGQEETGETGGPPTQILGSSCPGTGTSAEIRSYRGSAIALDTCLKSNRNLLAWTFSSSAGQSPYPTFKVLKQRRSNRGSVGACIATSPDADPTVALFGSGSDRSIINAAVSQCITQVSS